MGFGQEGSMGRKVGKIFLCGKPSTHFYGTITPLQIEEAEPSLQHFQNQSATEYLIEQAFMKTEATLPASQNRPRNAEDPPNEPNPSNKHDE